MQHGDTQWFVRDRFGLFIHWGLYALPARHEWVKHNEQITNEDYQKYFNYFSNDRKFFLPSGLGNVIGKPALFALTNSWAKFFQVDTAPFPVFSRIAAACMENDAFARAHPLKQPGAPAAV